MDFFVPKNIARVVDMLEKKGHEAYLVGGCVRDTLMGKVPNDYDIATSATPDETIDVFRGCKVIETGLKHGTVTVVMGGENVEVTTYRIDGEYFDNRRPATVTFTRSLTDDLSRRDFRCNAMAWSPTRGLADPFDGRRDIEMKTIASVGDARDRFNEDGLRILRALRFSSTLGFEIDPATSDAIHKLAPLLRNISRERIFAELKKLLTGVNVYNILMGYPDVIAVFIPEIAATVGFDQRSVYHIYDVWEHTAAAVAAAPADPTLRIAAFLHDVAKPECFSIGEDGSGHFYGHAERGGEMAEEILRRLKADNETIRLVKLLIHHHMDGRPAEKRSVKRMLRKMTPDEARMLIALRRADVAALEPNFGADTSHLDEIERLIGEIETDGDPVSVSSLDITGYDLIKLGIKPGPMYRVILEGLLEMVMDGEIENRKDVLVEEARARAERAQLGIRN